MQTLIKDANNILLNIIKESPSNKGEITLHTKINNDKRCQERKSDKGLPTIIDKAQNIIKTSILILIFKYKVLNRQYNKANGNIKIYIFDKFGKKPIMPVNIKSNIKKLKTLIINV